MLLVKDRISIITLVNELGRFISENGIKSVLVDFEKKTPESIALLALGGKAQYNDDSKIYFFLSDGELIKNNFEDKSLEYYVVKNATWVISGVIFPQRGREEGTMDLTISSSSRRVKRILENTISKLAEREHIKINMAY